MIDRMYIREVLEKYTSTRGGFEADEINPSMFIKSVIVWAPSEILSEWIELNDLPGVDDPNSMRDNNLRVGLESADQIIAMTERGLGSAKEVSEKLKEYGITRVLASISPLYLELQKLLRNELCGNSSPLCNNNAGSSLNGDILKNDMEIFENMERLINTNVNDRQ